MAKKRKATPEYLKALEQDLHEAKADLQKAKGELYMSSLDGKMFDLNFEAAREKALKATDRVGSLIKETNRVRDALADPQPELFGDD